MTDEDYWRMVDLWAEGRSVKAIARELGVRPAKVAEVIQYYREDFPQRWQWSTPMERERACEMRKRGMKVLAIARELGRAEDTVRRWLHDAGVA